MYKKNDLIELEITDMGNEGEGIGKIDSFPFFIKGAIIGDTVTAKVIKVKKNYAFARLMDVISPSADRVEPKCDVAGPCGGCQIQSMDYAAQLKFKENKVFNNLVRIGGVEPEFLRGIFEPIIGMEEPWRYRNKAQYPVSRAKDGSIIAGFYAGRTHSVIACSDCYIGAKEHKDILRCITSWMESEHIEPYDEENGSGIVRHILIREGAVTGEIMIVLVVNRAISKLSSDAAYKRLVSELKQIKLEKNRRIASIQVNENRENTNRILGRKCMVLDGAEDIEDILCGLSFRISPLSFYQVNPVQTEKLYSTAIEFADLKGDEEVWDVCCGIGTITLSVAKRMSMNNESHVRVHGIEIVPEAIENAKENAKRNGINGVEFICAAAEEYMPAHRNDIRADVIITDPPRKGMDERALEVMVSMNPERIVYVSCDSATLARDLKYLLANGYELKRVRACDMFPHSVHVESVCLLSRKALV